MRFHTQDIQNILSCESQSDLREELPQIAHRMKLVEMWNLQPGDHVLEVGCGQGDTTTVLAVAVGHSGRVVALDKASPDYGTPPVGEVQKRIQSSPFGKQITFHLSTDALNPDVTFREKSFDIAVFSHSSWYLSSPKDLLTLFGRVRPWAKHLGYAEWDIFPQNMMQIPHMVAVLLQMHIQSFSPAIKLFNVRSLILPQDARRMAEQAGWQILKEHQIDTSIAMRDGKEWEIENACLLAEQFLQHEDISVAARDLILREQRFLQNLFFKEKQRQSLSTYAFLGC